MRKARHAKGLSQEEPAYEADVDCTDVSALERGVYGATIDMADKLRRVLDVEANVLLQRPASSARDKIAWRRKITSRPELRSTTDPRWWPRPRKVGEVSEVGR